MGKKRTQRNIFGFDGSFINICDKIFDVMALGFLWILCSIPIVTIGASTSALYYGEVCEKWQRIYCQRVFPLFQAESYLRVFYLDPGGGGYFCHALKYRYPDEGNRRLCGPVLYLCLCPYLCMDPCFCLLCISGFSTV